MGFIDKGANVNYCGDISVLTVFIEKAKSSRWDETVLDLLLQKGADPNKYDKSNILSQTPLMSIADLYRPNEDPNRALEIIKKLLDHGAEINLEDYYGLTALDYAEEQNNKRIIDFLKSKGARNGSNQLRNPDWSPDDDSDEENTSSNSRQRSNYEENTGSNSRQQSTRDEYIRQIEAMTSEECQQKVKEGIIDKEYFFYNSIENKYANNQAVESIIEAVRNKGGKTAFASKKKGDNAAALRILVTHNSDLFKNVDFVRSIKQYLRVFHEALAKSYAEASDEKDNRNQLKKDHAYLRFLIVDKI